jgi:hypothetical protein
VGRLDQHALSRIDPSAVMKRDGRGNHRMSIPLASIGPTVIGWAVHVTRSLLKTRKPSREKAKRSFSRDRLSDNGREGVSDTLSLRGRSFPSCSNSTRIVAACFAPACHGCLLVVHEAKNASLALKIAWSPGSAP